MFLQVIWTSTALIAGMIVVFYFTVGVLALHTTTPTLSDVTVCDRVLNYEDGSTTCITDSNYERN